MASGSPSITVGSKRLWRQRNHLDAAQFREQQWRQKWDAARMFPTADGESGKTGGNETIRVDAAGRLRIKVPAALVDELGTHLEVAASAGFAHRGLDAVGPAANAGVAGRGADHYHAAAPRSIRLLMSERADLESRSSVSGSFFGHRVVDHGVGKRPWPEAEQAV